MKREVSSRVRAVMIAQLIPCAPRTITVDTLLARLRDRGVVIHKRVLQRNLVELSKALPIVEVSEEKPYLWRWADGVPRPAIPGGES